MIAPLADKTVYLSSNLGRARCKIAEIGRLAHRIDAQASDVGVALTCGNGRALSLAEITAETIRDLRIAAADLETFVRLHQVEESV